LVQPFRMRRKILQSIFFFMYQPEAQKYDPPFQEYIPGEDFNYHLPG